MILTVEEAKKYLNIDANDESQDDIILAFCRASHSRIEEYCGQPIEEETGYNYDFRGNGEQLIPLPFSRVSELTALSYRNNPLSDVASVTVGTEAVLYKKNSLFYIFSSKPFSENMFYSATIKAGFPAEQIPDAILQVAREMVGIMFADAPATSTVAARLGLGQIGKSDPASGSSTTTFINKWPDWQKVLDMYKIPNF